MALNVKITGLDMDRLLNMLICGSPGSGKTRMASTFPNPFIASCEAGLLSVRDRMIPSHEVKSPNEMDEILSLMRQTPEVRKKQLGVPVDTLIVDTIDNFQKLVKRNLLLQSGKSNLTMAEWGELGEKMRSYVAALRGLDVNVVVTCHIKKVTEEESGKTFLTPLLEGGYRDEIAGDFDIVGLLEARTRSVVQGQGTTTEIKRFFKTVNDNPQTDWLKDRSGVLPGLFEVNLDDDYDRMSKLIFKDSEGRKQALSEIQALQEKIDAVREEVEEQAPEPAPSAPEQEMADAKATSQTEANGAETVSSQQFQEMLSPFNDVTDDEKRLALKHEFTSEFGNPTILPVERFDEALSWVVEHVIPATGAEAPPDDDEAEAPETSEVETGAETEAETPETSGAGEVEDDTLVPERQGIQIPCSKKGCPVKHIDDEDVVELSKIKNGGRPLCAKHLKAQK